MKKMPLVSYFTLSVGITTLFLSACTSQYENDGASPFSVSPYSSVIISPKYIATSGGILNGKSVLIKDGIIEDVFANAEVAQKAKLNQSLIIQAPDDVLSPAFINTHDHINYNQKGPLPELSCENKMKNPDVTYNQRNDWRKGCRGLMKLTAPADNQPEVVAWNELRQLISGTTLVVSNGGTPGFVRNLGDSDDKNNLREGLHSPSVRADTFPLGDTAGCDYQLPAGDGYPKHPSVQQTAGVIYIAHMAEGVDAAARNEFTNISTPAGTENDKRVNILGKNVGLVHMVAVTPSDIQKVKDSKTTVIWSPRSNMALYGNTAPVALLSQQGINIALSTDWLYSGSANLLDELQVAQKLNADYFHHILSNQQLWKMVTVNPAALLDAPLGDIKPGRIADVVLFNVASRDKASLQDIYGLVINSSLQDVDMVMRSGSPVYGDKALLATFTQTEPEQWDPVDGAEFTSKLSNKIINTVNETRDRYPQALHFAQLAAMNQNTWGLIPDVNTEACPLPLRPLNRLANPEHEVPYPAFPRAEDKDQDGIKDGKDNKTEIFNPLRPVDEGKQINW
ncbi:amidohydrolase family protein [Citrobacter amalonaticus]|uniref:amidohydrolase family protein n=1 Tax=Citrobacter amalonaticus TaxID=35703 RepID=UPI00300C9245